MMGELFAQDQYGQQPRPAMMPRRQQPQQQPMMPQAPRAPFAQQAQQAQRMVAPQQASAGTQDMSNMYNAASGGGVHAGGPNIFGGTGAGGNLGIAGSFDPSMWNSTLPSGSLTGGY